MQNQELLALLNVRIKRVQKLIAETGADALLIFNQANYRYLTNFTGEEAQMIITKSGERVLLSDSRFKAQIKAQAPGELTVIMKTSNEVNEITQAVKKLAINKLLVEAEAVSALEFAELKTSLGDTELIFSQQLVEKARNIKDELEIATLQKAVEVSEDAFKRVLPLMKPGVSEKEIGAKLDYYFTLNGGGPGYDSIVASGYRSAWPHGVASEKKLAEHELVTIDAAAFYNGYTADITRTYAIGEVDGELEHIYQIVYEAQKRGIAAAVVGNTGKDVDNAARSYINDQGYGQYFGHGIGHGIGLEIHELCTAPLYFRDTVLENGVVHTVEPGIYLEGKGGVRIEDDILVDGEHPKSLSTLPKSELIHL